MKTAISLPDDLFVLAEEAAKRQGMSRSELYATALRAYLDAHRHDTLLEAINRACAELDTSLPEDLATVTRKRLLEVEW
jgi:metal-responsive CopG/Arc/MetJ family transcriptional regulator